MAGISLDQSDLLVIHVLELLGLVLAPFVLLFVVFALRSLRRVEQSITYQDRTAFLDQLRPTLARLGYFLESESGAFLTYRGTSLPSITKITVQLRAAEATVAGPWCVLKTLLPQLGAPRM
jgi:hypothetical protein